MNQEQDMRGAFFKNHKKENDKQPDYRGSAIIAGVKYWVSVWVAKSKKGETYFSVSYTIKDNQNNVQNPNKPDDPGDGMPF